MGDLDDRPDAAASGAQPAYEDDGNVVAWGQEVVWSDQDDGDVKDLNGRNKAARSLAPSLIGLTVEQAQHLVDEYSELSVAFRHPDQGHSTIGVFGRITAFVQEGVVTSAE